MDGFRLMSASVDEDGARLRLDGRSDREAVARALGEVMARRGYRLEAGTPLDGAWGSGSAVLRILLGGLVRRYKFRVAASEAPERLDVAVTKAMSGAFGGVLGWQRMKAETLALGAALRERFEREAR